MERTALAVGTDGSLKTREKDFATSLVVKKRGWG